jgi:uncharacterized protein YecE (DUF72 family)
MNEYDGLNRDRPPASTLKRDAVMIGCAGWSIPAIAADGFPTEGSHLERYAKVLPAVEINSSFYRPHQPRTYARWAATVPASFRFSVKVPRTITHEHRLQKSDDLMQRFLGEVENLEDKLGCLLVQLPPSLAFDPVIAIDFFRSVRNNTDTPIACEPRHASWFSELATQTLSQANVARVAADPNPVRGANSAGEADVTNAAVTTLLAPPGSGRMAYWRLHGTPVIYRSAYSPAFLEALNTQIDDYLATGTTKAAWCVFDNTAEGAAAVNALHLLRMRSLSANR